jgi:hypothetical protein
MKESAADILSAGVVRQDPISYKEAPMINKVLIFIAALFLLGWGVAHLVPTKSVVAGFGTISADNVRIITMEWIVEGAVLIFLAILTASVTYFDYESAASKTVFVLVPAMLVALTIISFFTGFRVDFLPFKLCPAIFMSSAILISVGKFF